MTEQLPSPTPQPAAPWNVLAIVSLVASIVGFSIVGIVTGHLSLGQIKRTGEQGHGLALAGTIIGYVTAGIVVLVAILALLAAVALPLFFVGTHGDYRY
jgi:uncharacterized membrane protein YjfL (UPF0719 family)